MQRLKIGWTLTAVISGILPLAAILAGCKGTYHSGGPTTATPTTRRTPGVTPGSTPGITPSGTPNRTPGATPGITPGVTPGRTPVATAVPTISATTTGTPSATPLAAAFVGSYSGNFALPSVEAGGSALNLTVSANGGAQGTVTLRQGNPLSLSGTVKPRDATSASLSLSGQTTSVLSNNLESINLTGTLSVAGAGHSVIAGSGGILDSENHNGTWSLQQTA